MAGQSGRPDLSGYNYGAISSLVLTADRSALPRRDREPPTSLAGRIDPREMGSRVLRQAPQAPKNVDKKKQKKASDRQEGSEKPPAKRKAEAAGFGYTDII